MRRMNTCWAPVRIIALDINLFKMILMGNLQICSTERTVSNCVKFIISGSDCLEYNKVL